MSSLVGKELILQHCAYCGEQTLNLQTSFSNWSNNQTKTKRNQTKSKNVHEALSCSHLCIGLGKYELMDPYAAAPLRASVEENLNSLCSLC